MATFEGTLNDFEKYIGPASNKIVTHLGKTLKKSQKSCQNDILGKNTFSNEYCGKYKSLDAAHFSHKRLDRKSIIKIILEEHFSKGELYYVDLDEFLNHYEQAHHPLNENLIMLCRQHHVKYDKHNHSVEADELEAYEIDEIISVSVNESQEIGIITNEIKRQLINKFNYLNNSNCNIARISGKDKFIWNFNIKKSNNIGFLLCVNQFDKSVTILKYNFTILDVGTPKKDKKNISLIIPYSETAFKDTKTNYTYEIVESIKLQ